jgi:hypothetical protein
MTRIILVLMLCFTPLMTLADAGDTRVVEIWNCELKDGKKMDDLKANNTKWLARARQVAGNDDVNSYAMSPIVGDQTGFTFVDTYPDMAVWSAVKSAESTPEGDAIDAAFEELMECKENRLLKSTQH